MVLKCPILDGLLHPTRLFKGLRDCRSIDFDVTVLRQELLHLVKAEIGMICELLEEQRCAQSSYQSRCKPS